MDWNYVIFIKTPPGAYHVFKLPLDLVPEAEAEFAAAVVRARAEVGCPDDWYDLGLGWDVATSSGEPHHTMLERATLHDWSAGIPV